MMARESLVATARFRTAHRRLTDTLSNFSWLPNLLLWAALVAGGVFGALAYHRINLAAIWFAAGLALTLSGIAFAAARPRD